MLFVMGGRECGVPLVCLSVLDLHRSPLCVRLQVGASYTWQAAAPFVHCSRVQWSALCSKYFVCLGNEAALQAATHARW
jgi:hypothetical protein